MNVFDVGDRVKIRGRFTVEGGAQDPTDVVVRVRNPGDDLSEFRFSIPADDVAREGAAGSGVFSKEIVLDQPGLWYAKIQGEGAVEAARTVVFRVRNDPFS